MPKYFLKKVWGYDPQRWPVIGFGQEAGARKLEREYNTGDWLILAGTLNAPTPEDDRGRMLGMIQITNTIVNVKDVLDALDTDLEEHEFDENGNFKWPFGFPYLKAFRFVNKPLLHDEFPGMFPDRTGAKYAAQFDQVSVERILEYEIEEDAFAIAPCLEEELRRSTLLGRGPAPGLGERNSLYEDGDNWVYIFKIAETNFYKIGRSNNPQSRLKQFNTAPHAIWSKKPLKLIRAQECPSAADAHRLEGLVHENLRTYHESHECFEVPKLEYVERALTDAIMDFAKHAN